MALFYSLSQYWCACETHSSWTGLYHLGFPVLPKCPVVVSTHPEAFIYAVPAAQSSSLSNATIFPRLSYLLLILRFSVYSDSPYPSHVACSPGSQISVYIIVTQVALELFAESHPWVYFSKRSWQNLRICIEQNPRWCCCLGMTVKNLDQHVMLELPLCVTSGCPHVFLWSLWMGRGELNCRGAVKSLL